MPISPVVSQRIDQSFHLINELDEQIGEPDIPADFRTTCAAACLNLARQHHRAVVALVQRELHGSAAAMLRVLWEAYLKGRWCHDAATDPELERFKSDQSVNFKRLVEQLPGYETFEKEQAAIWRALCSYTHTGFQALTWQIMGNSIEPCFADEQIVWMLELSDQIGKWSANLMSELHGHAAHPSPT